eukprot:scaffold8252_cov92-Cylindrotheca_fusiformis.AAC.6
MSRRKYAQKLTYFTPTSKAVEVSIAPASTSEQTIGPTEQPEEDYLYYYVRDVEVVCFFCFNFRTNYRSQSNSKRILLLFHQWHYSI